MKSLKFLRRSNKPLTATALLMVPVLVLSLAGLYSDPRTITGAPAWLKPAKFAVSISIYNLTLAWIFSHLPQWPRLRSWTGWTTSVVMVIEIVCIGLQAARGTPSHFNVATTFDAVIFGVMGAAILIAWLASIAVAVALFRQEFSDRVMGWALRIGVLITVLGAATGGLMTQPTGDQFAQARLTHQMPISGAHTVGAPDGGPGIPGTGWSREHGDLRVPHFFGLHAMQFLPLLAWLWKPRRPRAIIGAGAAYAGFYLTMLAQALAGRPFLGGLP
jgi:hypothetical protein